MKLSIILVCCIIIPVISMCVDISKIEPEKKGDVEISHESPENMYFGKLDAKLDTILKQFSNFQESVNRLETGSSAKNARDDRLLKIEQSLTHIQDRYESQTKLILDKYDSMLIQVTAAATKIDVMAAKIDETTRHVSLLDESFENVEDGINSIKSGFTDTAKIIEVEKEKLQTELHELKGVVISIAENVNVGIKETRTYLQYQLGLLASDHSLTLQSVNGLVNATASCLKTIEIQKQIVTGETAVLNKEIKGSTKELPQITSPKLPSSCAEIQRRKTDGDLQNGIFIVAPTQKLKVRVYCDFVTDGGGWTVFQRRDDVSTHIDFYLDWIDYKWGFGNLTQEFWLGLEPLYHIMNDTAVTLRVDMDDFEGNSTFAQYNLFLLENESNNYKLNVAWYTGTAGDSLSYSSGMSFSTKDRDLDQFPKSCATEFAGAWWYKACHLSNLNGKYLGGQHESFADGVNWKSFKGYNYSLKRTEMKIRPLDFTTNIQGNG